MPENELWTFIFRTSSWSLVEILVFFAINIQAIFLALTQNWNRFYFCVLRCSGLFFFFDCLPIFVEITRNGQEIIVFYI